MNKTLSPTETKPVSFDLGEKRKLAETKSEEYHSNAAEKKKKSEVCSTTLTAEVAQHPRRAPMKHECVLRLGCGCGCGTRQFLKK